MVNAECQTAFQQLSEAKKYRYIIYKIVENEVVVEVALTAEEVFLKVLWGLGTLGIFWGDLWSVGVGSQGGLLGLYSCLFRQPSFLRTFPFFADTFPKLLSGYSLVDII